MRAKISIPLARGLDQSLDERLRSAGELSELTNGEFDRQGAVSKRHGFSLVPALVDGEPLGLMGYAGIVRSIASTGDELLVRAYRSLYSFDDLEQAWRRRGALSPFGLRARSIFADALSYTEPDSAEIGGYTGHVSASSYQTGPNASDVRRAIVFRAETADQQPTLREATLAGPTDDTGGTSAPRAPKIATVSDGATAQLLPSWLEEDAGSWALKIASYRTATPTVAPVQVVAHADAWAPAASLLMQRTHDIEDCGRDGYAYAYVQTGTQNVEVYVRDAAHVVAANVSISVADPLASGHVLCALFYSAASNQIYLATARNATPAAFGPPIPGAIELRGLDPASLAVNFGPVVLRSLSLDDEVYALGVGEGVTESGDTRAATTWTRWTASETNSFGTLVLDNVWTELRRTDQNGVIIGLQIAFANAFALARPFYAAGRCYLVQCMTSGGPGYGSTCVIDAAETSAAEPQWALAARYDAGLSPTESTPPAFAGLTGNVAKMGALNSVSRRGSLVFWSSTSIANVLPGQLDTPRFSADHVEISPTATLGHGTASTGAALFGGAVPGWFTGSLAEELGFAGPPMIAVADEFGSGVGLLPVGTYHYCATWEAYDDEGVWHRSAPGEVVEAAITVPGNSVGITVRCLSGTTRLFAGRAFGAVVYRAESDGVFERISEPTRFTPSLGGLFCPVYQDDGPETAVGPVLFTTGGAEVEPSGPDGADMVLVGSERVFLAGFPRQDRIAYSKRVVAATPGEDAIAPEFADSFSFQLPGDARSTGMGELDDKVIIFTERAIYALAGRGPDDGGRNDDYSGLQRVSVDAGCIEPRSVVATPRGLLYRAPAGLYLLDRGLQVAFIGEAVRDITEAMATTTSAVLVPEVTQVRFTVHPQGEGGGAVLVWDYRVRAWSQWIVLDSLGSPIRPAGACMHNGRYHVLTDAGAVMVEDSASFRDANGQYVPLSVSTSWLQADQQSGWQRIRSVAALCAEKNAHDLTLELSQDFEAAASQSYTWTAAQIAAMAAPSVRELVEMRVSRQKSTAFRVRITDAESAATTTGAGYSLAGFSVEVSAKRGSAKVGSQQRT